MTSEKGNCPRCGGSEIHEGRVWSLAQLSSIFSGLMFRPKGVRRFFFRKDSIRISSWFYACQSCGLFWNEIKTKRL